MAKKLYSNIFVQRYHSKKRNADRVHIAAPLKVWRAAGIPEEGTRAFDHRGEPALEVHLNLSDAAEHLAAVEAYEVELRAQMPQSMRAWSAGEDIDGFSRKYILTWWTSLDGNKIVNKAALKNSLGLTSSNEIDLLWELLNRDEWISPRARGFFANPHGIREAYECLGILRILSEETEDA